MSRMSFEELKQQSLALTSLFETSRSAPECFGRVAGNFDDAGLSFGAIQFNFLWQTVNPIFEGMINNHPEVTKQAWNYDVDPSYYNTFVDVVMNRTKEDQIAWGDSISDPNNKHNVLEPWKSYFEAMGVTQECINLQIEATQWYFDQALSFFEYFEFYSLRAYALCFDISVQNGSISQAVKDQVWEEFDQLNLSVMTRAEIETELMVILANKRAEAVSSQWVEVVRERKLAIAYGSGWVHGGTLFADTESYGLTLDPAFEDYNEEYQPIEFPSRTEDHVYGIDVSEYQGTIDYQKVKDSGVKYVILRAYGSNHSSGGDTRVAEYYQGFKGVGIPCGSYFYAWIDDVNDLQSAREQADMYADKLEEIFGSDNFGDLMPFLDLESNQNVVDSGLRTPTSGLSHDQLDTTLMLRWANEFRNHFQSRTDRRLGLYTAHYWVQETHNNFNEGVTTEGNILKDMPLWVAAFDKYGYTQPLPSVGGWNEWTLYQYSEDGNGTEHGVGSATLDLNRSKAIEWLRPPMPVTQFTAQPNIEGNMNLSWRISPDEDIDQYHVYVDGDWVAALSNVSQSYTVEGLEENQQYTFWILAQDVYGETQRSEILVETLILDENVAPLTPTGLTATSSDQKVILTWVANQDEVYSYNIYVNDKWYKFTSETEAEVLDLENEVEYKFEIDADFGTNSLKTEPVYSTPTENIPNAATDLSAEILGNKSVTLRWNHVPKESFSHFEVYLNNTLLISDLTVREYNLTVPEYNVDHTLRVHTVDINGRSTISSPIVVRVRVPNAPSNVLGTPLDRSVHLTWNDYEENWVTGFNIFDEWWNYITTVMKNEATITGLVNGTTYSFKVQAFTNEEITSDISPTIYVTPVIEYPNPPENFSVTLNEDRTVNLSWTHEPKEFFSHYRITANGQTIVDNHLATSYNNVTVETNTTIEFIVYAVDTDGDETKSRNISISINVPQGITGLMSITGDREITLIWNKSPEAFVNHYDVYIDGQFHKNTQQREMIIKNLNNGSDYNFTVYPVSDQGYQADTSPTVVARPTDSYPNPAIELQASVTRDREIRLSWEHTSKHNFSHYRVMVNGSLYKDNLKDKLIFIKNVEYNSTLSINVVTVDQNQRETWSTDVLARIDVPAPPSSVEAQGGNRRVFLSWEESEEDFVIGYGIYERGFWYDFTSNTSITIPFKTNNITYTYQIVAITKDQIYSDKSEEVSATPQLVLPEVPIITTHNELGTGEAEIFWDQERNEDFSHYRLFINAVLVADNLVGNSFVTGVLERNVYHTINVEAINVFGDTSGWSEDYSLMIYAEQLNEGTGDQISLGEIDLKRKPIKPQLFLCKPNRTTIAKLNEAFNIRQNARLADINEIYFELPYKVRRDRKIIRNPHIDQLKERFVVRLELGEKKEYYIITKTNDVSSDDGEMKEITAYSLGYELRDYIINNYDEMPRSLIEHCRDFLYETDWAIGQVDSEITIKNRPFSADNRTVLDVIQELAETYDAVIQWDTVNRIVHFKEINKIGQNKGLRFSYGKYLTNIGKESNADEMVTQLIVRGQDGLTIRSVNPTGSDYIESFDYFIYPFERDEDGNVIQSSYYMSDSLAGALVDYKNFVVKSDSRFAAINKTRSKLEDQIVKKESEIIELEGTLATAEGLVDNLKALERHFYFERNFTGTRIVIDQPLKYEFNYIVMAKVSDDNNILLRLDGVEKEVKTNEWVVLGKIAKNTVDDELATSISIDGTATNVKVDIQINSILQTDFDKEDNEQELINKYNENHIQMQMDLLEEELKVFEDDLDELLEEIEILKDDLKLGNFFTEEQLKERSHYIIQRTWTNENISNAEELRVEAEKEFRNLQEPNIVITTSIVNLLEIVEEQRNWKKLKLGDVLTVHHESLGIDIQAKIMEIDYNYEQGEITLTISNLKDIKSDKENFLKALYGAITTSTAVNSERHKWDQSVQTARNVEDFMSRAFDATKQTIVAGTNQSIEISRRGLLIRDIDDPDNFLIGQHKVLAITNDGGKSYKNAITTDGVVGERIYGRILAGVNLIIENVSGTFKVNEDGVVIDGSALQVIGGIDNEHLNIDRSGQSAFMENSSTANDNIDVPPRLPEISTLGDAIQHTLNNDGSANISFEWIFDNEGDEGNIDGFIVYVYQSSSSAKYSFGTNEINEFSYNVNYNKRSVTFYALPSDRYYTFGVKAYRMVDEEISAVGYFDTAIVTIDFDLQNPYKPTLHPAFEGDIKGTISSSYLNVDVKEEAFNSVLLGHSYNNIQIDINSGLLATKNNDLARTILNATDGIKIQTRESVEVPYDDVFWIDTNGQLVTEGMRAKALEIEDGDGNLIIDAKEGILNLNNLVSINGQLNPENLIIGSTTIFRNGYDPKELMETGVHVLADSPDGINESGLYHTSVSSFGLHLKNETTINISYATLYAKLDNPDVQMTGTIQLIRKDTQEIVESKVVFLGEGYNRVLLNFLLRKDVGEYFLRVFGDWVGGSIYRTVNTITKFPYSNGSFTIESGGTLTTPNEYYYYFYDIAISGERVEGTFINDKTLEKWKVEENGETKIDGGLILTRSIKADSIAVGTLTSDLISTVGLDAKVITSGTLDAKKVTVRTDFGAGAYVRLDALGLRAYDGVKETFNIDSTGKARFSGDIIGGKITSNTSIEITTDAKVGQNLDLGFGSTGTNYLRLNNMATISGNAFAEIIVSASRFYILDGDTYIGEETYNITDNHWTSGGREEGFCGIGARNIDSNEANIAGVGVNFKRKRKTTPLGCSFSTSSSNKGANITDYNVNGFWLYMVAGTSQNGYYYWRGTYVVQD